MLTKPLRDSLYLAAIQNIPHVGPQGLRRLVEYAKTPQAAWHLICHDVVNLEKAKIFSSEALHSIRLGSHEEALENLMNQLEAYAIGVISYLEVDFPKPLQEIYNPPAILYYRGNRSLLQASHLLAMVGARKCSPYGKNCALHFSGQFAQYGIVIVSGGARGIDRFSHQGCLEVGGATIAVMGCGLDQAYPKENAFLFQRILENQGLLLSEYPPFTEPKAYHFPARNRIISGLCKATIVIEAKASSGSLITADMAINEGREVFTVPGNVLDNYASGNHWLIRQGAQVLIKASDLLEELGWSSLETSACNCQGAQGESNDKKEGGVVSLTVEEREILNVLSCERGLGVDDILALTGIELTSLYPALLSLEMKAYIEKMPSQGYIVRKSRSD